MLNITEYSDIFYRRNRNSPDEDAANGYEMPNDVTSRPGYTTVQSGAGAPAQSTNPTLPPRPSLNNDTTLIDNDPPSDTVDVNSTDPTTANNARAPAVYSVVRKSRSGDESMNATSSADKDSAPPPARSSSHQDITLIDNDLYE